jgi:hypothetical protein
MVGVNSTAALAVVGLSTPNAQRGISSFISVRLDLGIFRKLFRKVTGIGQQVDTVGQSPSSTTPSTQ